MWWLEQDSNPRPFGRKVTNLPMSYHTPICLTYLVGEGLQTWLMNLSVQASVGVTDTRDKLTKTHKDREKQKQRRTQGLALWALHVAWRLWLSSSRRKYRLIDRLDALSTNQPIKQSRRVPRYLESSEPPNDKNHQCQDISMAGQRFKNLRKQSNEPTCMSITITRELSKHKIAKSHVISRGNFLAQVNTQHLPVTLQAYLSHLLTLVSFVLCCRSPLCSAS